MKTSENIKILMLASAGTSSRIVFHYLKNEFPHLEVVVEPPPARWKMLKNRAKKLGWATVFGQLIFQTLAVPFLTKIGASRRRAIFEKYHLDDAPIPTDKVRYVSSVNASDCHQILKSCQADVILINGTRIVSRKTLAVTDIPFVNTHLGITPKFRGVHGGYWALATGQPECFGATIHFVDAGVDTGGILRQVYCQPSQTDNFTTYPLLALAEVLPALKSTLLEVGQKKSYTLPPADQNISKQWYHPTIFQYLTNFFARGVR